MPNCFSVSGKKPRFRLPVIASLVVFGSVAATTTAQVWTQVSSVPTTQQLKGIVYANSQFVIVGSNGTIITSPDGSLWTLRTSGVSRELTGVAASTSLFVAVGDSGTILSSPNGVTWTRRTSNTIAALNGVACSGTTFVVVGLDSTVLTSTNGTSWTKRSLGVSTDLFGVAWGAGKFVVAGFDGLFSRVSTSTNGTAWTPQTVQAGDGLLSLSWCDGAFIAGSIGVAVSPDGVTWNLYSDAFSDFINGAAGHANRFVVVGNGGVIESSSDDSTWTAENSGTDVRLNCAAWGGNVFVAAGAGGTILTSPVTSGILDRRAAVSGRSPVIAVGDRSVRFSLFADAAVTMRLYSAQGRLVRSMGALLCKGDHAAPATFLSGLAKGRYLLSFKAGSYTIQQAVLIAK